jgi:hypothetical protein
LIAFEDTLAGTPALSVRFNIIYHEPVTVGVKV